MKRTSTANPKIRRLRLERGLMLKFVAEKVGVTPQYLCMAESERLMLSERVQNKLSEFYGLPVCELMEYSL